MKERTTYIGQPQNTDGTLVVKPTKVFYDIEQAHNEGKRFVMQQGSSRSGKTYNITYWYDVQAYNHNNLKVAVVRATMPRLKNTAYKDFQETMRNLRKWEPSRMNEKDMEYKLHNGSSVKFFATEDSMAAQGPKYNIVFINEANEVDYNVVKQLSIRMESKTKEKDGYDFTAIMIMDFNPSFPDDHWIVKMKNAPVNKDRLAFFKTTYKDNPYLTPDQVADIESLKETDHRLWVIYGLGEQCLVEGLIYDNYSVCEKIPDYLWRDAVVGVDWGYKDPFAVTLVAIDHRKREVYLKEVCYRSMMSDEEQREVLLREPCRGRRVICDNAEPQLIDKMRKAGIRISGAKKRSRASSRSIVPGISVMKSYKIYITEDSTNGLIEADNYTWKRDRNGDWLNEPIDKFNHFWDSARYVVYTLGHSVIHGLRGGIIIHR